LNPKDTDPKSRPTSGLEENLKKALTELLILFLFGEGNSPPCWRPAATVP